MTNTIPAKPTSWRGYIFVTLIIFANGILQDPVREAAHWIKVADLIIAADGGTRHALAAGCVPHHIIGDLDSFDLAQRAQLEQHGTRFHSYPPAKDETDLELSLLWAVEQAPSEIVILGALGGRPDQALANLLLLAMPELDRHIIRIAAGAWTIRCLRGGTTHTLHGTPGDTFSLIPLNGPAAGIHTTGLTYPLNDETLYVGPARGVSNTFATEQATLTFQQGHLWCFHESKSHLSSPSRPSAF